MTDTGTPEIRKDYDRELVDALHAAHIKLGEAHKILAEQTNRLIAPLYDRDAADFSQVHAMLDQQEAINNVRFGLNRIVEAELYADGNRDA